MNVREDILSWMSEREVFTMEEVAEFAKSKINFEEYRDVVIELLDSQIVTSMYGYYKLNI